MLSQFPGLLVIGSYNPQSARQSVELWSPAESCVLEDYPRDMYIGPTVNLVSGELVGCYEDSCDIYDRGEWNNLVDTRERRRDHSTAVKDDRLLLIGGLDSRTTEWIPIDGSLSQPGPFDVRHAEHHCTLQISNNIINRGNRHIFLCHRIPSQRRRQRDSSFSDDKRKKWSRLRCLPGGGR